MREVVDRLIKSSGKAVLLDYPGGERVSTKAIVLPLFTKNGGPARTATQLGSVSRLRWRYIGPMDAPLYGCEGVVLTWNGGEYEFVWAKSYDTGGAPTHWEGLLKRRERAFGQT